jgi:hypothetical protein
LNNVGVYRFGTQAIDRELNFSTRESVVVRIGGATGEPPTARATIDKLSGAVPLTVNIDMSASSDADGSIQNYFFNCGGGTFTPGSPSSNGSCTFNSPGVYWIMLQVRDNSGSMDLISAYATATPVPGGSDTTPPTVNITSPAPGATVSGNVSITAGASDASGINKVEFHLDAPAGALLGADTTSPYSITWDSGNTSPGSHTLYAVATDGAGNPGTSPAVGITVNAPTPPQVSVTSPVNGSTVPRRSTVTI